MYIYLYIYIYTYIHITCPAHHIMYQFLVNSPLQWKKNRDEISIFSSSGHCNNNTTTVVFPPALYLLSAGIGRTGCFIASSIGCQQLRETRQVDILETVCQLRLDRLVHSPAPDFLSWLYHQTSHSVGLPSHLCRGGMIQTTEQYQFLYSTLAQYSCQLHRREVHTSTFVTLTFKLLKI